MIVNFLYLPNNISCKGSKDFYKCKM